MRAQPRGIQVREIARDCGTLTAARGRPQVGACKARVARARPKASAAEFDCGRWPRRQVGTEHSRRRRGTMQRGGAGANFRQELAILAVGKGVSAAG